MLSSGARKSLGGIAQLVERLVRNEKARGSNPLTSTSAGIEVYGGCAFQSLQPMGVSAHACRHYGLARGGEAGALVSGFVRFLQTPVGADSASARILSTIARSGESVH